MYQILCCCHISLAYSKFHNSCSMLIGNQLELRLFCGHKSLSNPLNPGFGSPAGSSQFLTLLERLKRWAFPGKGLTETQCPTVGHRPHTHITCLLSKVSSISDLMRLSLIQFF